MYHNVDTESGFNTVSVSSLKEQLLYLKCNYKILSLDKYTDNLNRDGSFVAITVDDAYISFKDKILPLLNELDIPATLFVPVDHVGKFNIWDREKRIDIMGWNDLRTIAKEKNVTIGSHGKSHKRFSGLNNEEIEKEIIESKQKLEKELSYSIRHFSFPFGQLNDYTEFSIEMLKNSAYFSSCSTRYGRKNNEADRYQMFRIEVEPDDTLEDFKRKCNGRLHRKLIKRHIKEILINLGVIK